MAFFAVSSHAAIYTCGIRILFLFIFQELEIADRACRSVYFVFIKRDTVIKTIHSLYGVLVDTA
jgi:hypothetical protein